MDKKLLNIAQVLSKYCDSTDCDRCLFDHIVSDDCRCPVDRTRSALQEILQADNTVFDETGVSKSTVDTSDNQAELELEYYKSLADHYELQYERLRSFISDLAEHADFDVSEKTEPIFDVDDDDEE